jgi:DNA-binding NarL/FixJ family response regulator
VLKTDGVAALKKALRIVFAAEQPGAVTMYYSPSVEFRYRISRRERDIIQDAAAGMSSEQSALHRTLSPSTVATYRTRLLNKFRQDEGEPMTMAKVVAIALREGLIQ